MFWGNKKHYRLHRYFIKTSGQRSRGTYGFSAVSLTALDYLIYSLTTPPPRRRLSSAASCRSSITNWTFAQREKKAIEEIVLNCRLTGFFPSRTKSRSPTNCSSTARSVAGVRCQSAGIPGGIFIHPSSLHLIWRAFASRPPPPAPETGGRCTLVVQESS